MDKVDVFLAEICERPWDKTPRLIFADWLEDQGDDGYKIWAGMIRGVWNSRKTFYWYKVWPRLASVVQKIGLELWIGGDRFRYADTVGPPIRADTPALVVFHGFGHTLRCTTEMLEKYGGEVAKALPLWGVQLTDREPHRTGLITEDIYGYVWVIEGYTDGTPVKCMLPLDLWRHLQKKGERISCYALHQGATDALRLAGVLWAREMAGYPELTGKDMQDFTCCSLNGKDDP